MTTYRVKLVSLTNSIVFVITALTIFLVSAGTLLPPGGLQNEGLLILAVSITTFMAYILWQKFVTGRTEWTVDANEIRITWTKKFILAHNKDIIIKWSEIENIKKGLDTNYYNLKFKFVSGETLTFYHDNIVTRDNFQELLKVLYQTLNDKKLS